MIHQWNITLSVHESAQSLRFTQALFFWATFLSLISTITLRYLSNASYIFSLFVSWSMQVSFGVCMLLDYFYRFFNWMIMRLCSMNYIVLLFQIVLLGWYLKPWERWRLNNDTFSEMNVLFCLWCYTGIWLYSLNPSAIHFNISLLQTVILEGLLKSFCICFRCNRIRTEIFLDDHLYKKPFRIHGSPCI